MTKERRIVYVVNAFESDAPTAVTISLGQGMKEQGWDVAFVAWARGGLLQEGRLNETDIPTRVLGHGLLRNAWALARYYRKFRPTIVHASLARPTLGVAVARFFIGRNAARWIASDHGVHEWREKGALIGRIMEAIMPAALSTYDAVISVSKDAARELTRRGLKHASVIAVPNGVDIRRFYPRPTEHKLKFLRDMFPNDEPARIQTLIGSAGNLREIKGYDVLINSMPAILDEAPLTRCVIWGDGPELDRLKSLTHALEIDHAVKFAGYAEHMELLLPLLDIYVQPSRVESFGMATAEAMACGVPVVISDVGGLKVLIKHGVSGRSFPSGDSTALAKHVLILAAEKWKRHRTGEAGRLRVLEFYSRQKMIDTVSQIYEGLIKGGGQ